MGSRSKTNGKFRNQKWEKNVFFFIFSKKITFSEFIFYFSNEDCKIPPDKYIIP